MSKDLMKYEGNYLISDNAIRVAEFLSKSTLVPQHFRGNIGNCLIALNVASRSGADPFMVMQSLYLVHGKPAFEAKYLIAAFNACGRFEPIEYKFNADKTECSAYSKVIKTGKRIVGPTISVKMAKQNGWWDKNGSKWPTMTELMLTYRAASWLISAHAPEIKMGIMTTDEAVDVMGKQVQEAQYEVQQEIVEHANQKVIDFKPEPPSKEPEPEPVDPNVATLAQAKEIMSIEKHFNRDKAGTLKNISGFAGREISKISELTKAEAEDYIQAIKDEMNEIENLNEEQPTWMNEGEA